MKRIWGFFLLLALLGCQQQAPPQAVASASPRAAADAPPQATASAADLTLNVPGVVPALRISPDGQITAVDGSWSTRRDGSEVQVLEGQAVVATIAHKEAGRWDFKGPDGQRTAKIKQREDGDYKVEDASEKMLVKLKRREDGYKVVDSDEETVLLKVSARDGKVKIKDGKETELAKIEGTNNTLLLAWLATEKLPLPLRLGMATSTWSPSGG